MQLCVGCVEHAAVLVVWSMQRCWLCGACSGVLVVWSMQLCEWVVMQLCVGGLSCSCVGLLCGASSCVCGLFVKHAAVGCVEHTAVVCVCVQGGGGGVCVEHAALLWLKGSVVIGSSGSACCRYKVWM